MAIRSAIKYIGEFIRIHSGSATYLPSAVSSGAKTLRVLNIGLFDPSGGVCYFGDSFIDYTGISGNTLTGIPGSGDGSIAATLNEVSHATAPSLIYTQGLSEKELEDYIDRFRVFVDPELSKSGLKEDVEKKIYWGGGQWFDTGVKIRDADGTTFTEITPDTVDYERGVFEFNTARTENTLYVAGWRYNPFYVLAEIFQRAASNDPLFKYLNPDKQRESLLERKEAFLMRGRSLEH